MANVIPAFILRFFSGEDDSLFAIRLIKTIGSCRIALIVSVSSRASLTGKGAAASCFRNARSA